MRKSPTLHTMLDTLTSRFSICEKCNGIANFNKLEKIFKNKNLDIVILKKIPYHKQVIKCFVWPNNF